MEQNSRTVEELEELLLQQNYNITKCREIMNDLTVKLGRLKDLHAELMKFINFVSSVAYQIEDCHYFLSKGFIVAGACITGETLSEEATGLHNYATLYDELRQAIFSQCSSISSELEQTEVALETFKSNKESYQSELDLLKLSK